MLNLEIEIKNDLSYSIIVQSLLLFKVANCKICLLHVTCQLI